MLAAAAILLYAGRPTLGCFVVALVLIVLGDLKLHFRYNFIDPARVFVIQIGEVPCSGKVS